MRLLIVEDEQKLSDNIKQGLTEQGFAVDQSFDGEDGLFLAETEMLIKQFAMQETVIGGIA